MSNLTRTKALIALAFAAGTLGLPTASAYASNGPDSVALVIQEISKSNSYPENKSYRLFSLAKYLLCGGSFADTDKMLATPRVRLGPRRVKMEMWSALAKEAAYDDWSCGYARFTPSHKGKALADEALKSALKELTKSTDIMCRQYGFFCASYLFKQIGDMTEQRKCEEIIESVIKASETEVTAEDERVMSSAAILQLQSFNIIPIAIPEKRSENKAAGRIFSQEDFDKAEAKLSRAATLLDRFPEHDDARRRVHRDLALWYEATGKTEKSQREKQKLFALVGWEDDELLYPRSESCGHLVWWQKSEVSHGLDGSFAEQCGMG